MNNVELNWKPNDPNLIKISNFLLEKFKEGHDLIVSDLYQNDSSLSSSIHAIGTLLLHNVNDEKVLKEIIEKSVMAALYHFNYEKELLALIFRILERIFITLEQLTIGASLENIND